MQGEQVQAPLGARARLGVSSGEKMKGVKINELGEKSRQMEKKQA